MDFAILAPVPEEHLDDGADVAAAEDFVCFATNDFEFFREVDAMRGIDAVPILFYQSHDSTGTPKFETLWSGSYEGKVEDTAEKMRLEAKHRPPSTAKYATDNAVGWGTFYKVRGLRRIATADRIPFYKITLYKSGKKKMSAAPRKPLLIDRPAGF